MKLNLFFLQVFIFLQIHSFGQKEVYVKIFPDTTCSCYSPDIFTEKKFQNQEQAEMFLNRQLTILFSDAYLTATYDSVKISDTLITAKLHCGKQYFLGKVNFANTCNPLNHNTVKRIFSESHIFSEASSAKSLKKITNTYANKGYPFASAGLTEISIRNDSINCVLACNKGPYITFDSICNKGTLLLDKTVLTHLLGFENSCAYSERAVRQIDERLKEYPFIRQVKKSEIIFTENSVVITTFLDKRPANKFDGIIGFVPDYRNASKLLLTGDLSFEVWNALNYGEQFQVFWRRPEPLSQSLKFKASVPSMVLLPVGASYDLFLLKKDTTFINTENTFSIFYKTGVHSLISGYVKYFSSSLLSTKQYNAEHLPQSLDMKVSSIGIVFSYNYNEKTTFLQKGFFLNADCSLGNKKILKNTGIADDLYSNIQFNTYRILSKTTEGIFINFKKRSALLLRNINGVVSTAQMFDNELVRIGGLKTLRGFDEQQFFCSMFSVQTIEYRFYLEKSSWFSVFTDKAYLEQKTMSNRTITRPLGMGFGMTFETSAGLFTVNYAVGKTESIPLQLKSAKIHFGFLKEF